MRSAATVGTELGLAQLPVGALAHPGDGSGITEQHGGVAIFRVDDLRVGVSGDQQAVFQPRRFHEAFHGIQAIDIARAAQGNIEGRHMGRQAQFVLNDGRSMRQPFFITILGNDNQGIDGRWRQARVGREQSLDCLHTQVGGFLTCVFTRQEGRADLAENEFLVLGELRTLGVVVHALDGYVTRNAFDANHCGFPILMRIFTGTGTW
ncbi:hypothetical protein D3C79_824690 [compost metagenome]